MAAPIKHAAMKDGKISQQALRRLPGLKITSGTSNVPTSGEMPPFRLKNSGVETINASGLNRTPADWDISGRALVSINHPRAPTHRPMTPLDQPGSIGSPTTVVYATGLSTPA